MSLFLVAQQESRSASQPIQEETSEFPKELIELFEETCNNMSRKLEFMSELLLKINEERVHVRSSVQEGNHDRYKSKFSYTQFGYV